jgi:hypothetical protein
MAGAKCLMRPCRVSCLVDPTEGIVEFRITVGPMERHLFEEKMRDDKSQARFELVDHDLSGKQQRQVYLWFLRGKGRWGGAALVKI